ncbi:hypothetical protein GCM10009715_28530 [Paeniglutamicibacter psychrophenolicus]|uniref:Uncharacterized protein n=1 Tax=Paeniglutamicibacter psychrophenolicus TaxID=257454 RepID=A0ABS4WGE7_9MICC|nr:hypothetical protein [Paeniglutamicibacter psychrophenolicus]
MPRGILLHMDRNAAYPQQHLSWSGEPRTRRPGIGATFPTAGSLLAALARATGRTDNRTMAFAVPSRSFPQRGGIQVLSPRRPLFQGMYLGQLLASLAGLWNGGRFRSGCGRFLLPAAALKAPAGGPRALFAREPSCA